MATVWQKSKNGNTYEVRSAGNSLRLYTNGVFHSQWNSRRPLSGQLWDLFLLPIFFHPNYSRIDRALILGVGGGAVINLLCHFLNVRDIVGVDLDDVHLALARKFFLDDSRSVQLHCVDAKSYLRNDRSKYDLIVEDLFSGADYDKSEAVRAIPMDKSWFEQLAKRLREHGLLVINFESPSQLRKALPKNMLVEHGFDRVYQLSLPKFENAIAACLRAPCEMHIFRQALNEVLSARSKRETAGLNYTIKRVV